MNIIKRFSLLVVVLVLAGQGCITSSKTSAADGSVWFTDNYGKGWTQLESLPQPTTVATTAGVNVTSIEIDPSDHSAIYMGTEANGMFYSLDSGQSWSRPENTAAKTGEVLDIEVHPKSVCTTFLVKKNSILKSSDCVRTYEEVYTEGRSDESLVALAIDWFNPDTLWVGTTAGDILRSSNGGRSWTKIFKIKDEIAAIEVSNSDSRIILVGTEDKGFWRSIDSGASWQEFEKELSKEFRGSDEVYGFSQTRDGSTLLMNTEFGILRSNNSGSTWESVSLISSRGEVRIWSMAIDPENGDAIYYGIEGTFYSSDSGGSSWVTEDMPSKRAPKFMLVHPSKTNSVLTGFAAIEK